jgi:phospholipid-binding lipoprotein MlaA
VIAAAVVAAFSLLPGTLPAATPAAAPAKAKGDPFERVNRATWAFNDALDRMLARPAAKAYKRVVPEPARNAVSGVLANLEYPTVAFNDALQGKFQAATQDVGRFLVNTTVGVGGVWDPATKFGIPRHDEDFGQTLGYWGVPTGPYVVLPVFGPSDFRDGPGKLVDRYTNVRHYIGSGSTEYYLYAIAALDTRTQLLSADQALKSAFDPYALARDAYLARRNYLVHDGQVQEESYDEPDASAGGDDAPAGTPPKAP